MKVLVLTSLLALSNAQISFGEACENRDSVCEAGLCCGEGVYEDDIVNGQVSTDYKDNMVVICNEENAEEYEDPDNGELYYFTCFKDLGNDAFKLFAGVAAAASLLYIA